MLRFIILFFIATSVVAQEQNPIDADLVKQVQKFAEDVNKSLPINPIFVEQQQSHKKLTESRLIIFISTSMPEKSIQQWAKQADCIGAELVIRGFVNNSFKDTITVAQQLFSKEKAGGFSVDPFIFKKYAIESVPTVVLDIDGNVDIVRGDIGLIEALKLIQAKGENYIYAQRYLSKM